jgi:hypothetical protein
VSSESAVTKSNILTNHMKIFRRIRFHTYEYTHRQLLIGDILYSTRVTLHVLIGIALP